MECSVRLAIDLCRDIENGFAEIYSHYARVFAEPPAIRDLWQRIAEDERKHADLLATAQGRDVREAAWDAPKFRDCRYLIEVIGQTLQMKTTRLTEALRTAIRLEKELQAVHRECAAFFAGTADAPLFALLLHAEEEHLQELERAYNAVLCTGSYQPPPALRPRGA